MAPQNPNKRKEKQSSNDTWRVKKGKTNIRTNFGVDRTMGPRCVDLCI